MTPAWFQVLLAGIALARELIKYLREHRQCSKQEQVLVLEDLKEQAKLAREIGRDFFIKV